MVSIFDHRNYRAYIHERFKKMPKAGYGQLRKLAQFLGVHTTLVSQVLSGGKTFTLEQAAHVGEYLGLSEMEFDYFLLLVQLDRAGTPTLRKNLLRQIESLHKQAQELSNRLTAKGQLRDTDRAIFYSDWAYSAVRQMTAIQGFQDIDSIAVHLSLSTKRTKEIIEFLLSLGLCREEKGQLKIGPTSTHLGSNSHWVRMHHLNWRQKAVEHLNEESVSKLHYTAPMTLSVADAEKIRELIVQFLESVDKIVEPSPSEDLFCLNVDWFKV